MFTSIYSLVNTLCSCFNKVAHSRANCLAKVYQSSPDVFEAIGNCLHGVTDRRFLVNAEQAEGTALLGEAIAVNRAEA